MLFCPWRNEEIDILSNDNESSYNVHKQIIETNRRIYEFLDETLFELV